MIRWFQLLSVACIVALFFGPLARAEASASQGRYDIKPIINPATGNFDAVDFTLSFRGDKSGKTILLLPNDWGGSDRLYQHITALKASGATIAAGDAPRKRVLNHKPSAKIRLTYRIVQAQLPPQEDRMRGSNDYRPIVQPDFLHLIGTTWAIAPESWGNDTKLSVKIAPLSGPHSLVSDLQHHKAGQAIRLEELMSSITMAGDIRVHDAGNGARIAIRGKMDKRSDAEWVAAFSKIAATTRDFWKSKPEPFLVTVWLTPGEGLNSSTGGTGLGDAFAFMATSNADPKQIDDTMMHEMTHSWIPRKIGGFHDDGRNEAEGYWLSEGFTDYLKMRLMVSAGFWSAKDYANAFNAASLELALLPDRETPNTEAAKTFWTTRSGGRLPYLRGAIFAALLDEKLREQGADAMNFDDFLLDMQHRALTNKDADAEALLREAMAAAGVRADELIAQHIDEGKPMTLSTSSFAPCGKVELAAAPQWEPGFDLQKSLQAEGPQKLVTGVIKDGPAWRAGLRDGQEAIGWSFYFGDTSQDMQIDVLIDNKPVSIKWLPVSDSKTPYQKLVIDPALSEADKAWCLKRLGAI
jgi:predicted metalloprotease with PDZ domain